MTTILFYGCIGLVAFMLIARLPGMHMLLLPIFSFLTGAAKAVMEGAMSWIMFFVLSVLRAHRDILMHLFSKEADYNVEVKMQEKSDI